MLHHTPPCCALQGVHARLLALKHRIAVLRAEDHTLWDVLPLERQLDAIDADRSAAFLGLR